LKVGVTRAGDPACAPLIAVNAQLTANFASRSPWQSPRDDSAQSNDSVPHQGEKVTGAFAPVIKKIVARAAVKARCKLLLALP
jgi:hypothetical protein